MKLKSDKGGFALVIALSLMAFVLVLLLAVSTFVTVETKVAGTQLTQVQARSNALWLALHDDMAEPSSPDPVSRESTRVDCAAVLGAQTSLDPKQIQEWTPNSRYGGHAFGFMDPSRLRTRDTQFKEFLEHRNDLIPWIELYSPIEHVSSDDPMIGLLIIN